MNSFLFVVIAVFSVIATIEASTPFSDCGSQGAKIVDLKVGDCSTLPCVFKRGTNVSFAMDFTAKMDITSANTKVYAYIGPIKIPHPLPDPNSCHFMKCPIKNGGSGTYKQSFEVLKAYPQLNLVAIQWEILSGNTMITCFKMTVKIV